VERVTKRRPQNLLESFNFAFEGIIHVLRTQRNLRIHFLAAGHYNSERLGIRALGEHVAARFGVEHRFIDVPNPV